MLILGTGVVPSPSSAGGAASSIRQATPSAGATTTPGRVGGVRGGCRKNPALATAAARPARRSQRCLRPAAATASAAEMKGNPAGWTGGTEERTRAASRCGPDCEGRSGRLATCEILRFLDQDRSHTVT